VARPLAALTGADTWASDLLVNTTTVGLRDDLSPLPAELLPAAGLVVDIIYNPPRTRLLRQAEGAGLAVMNGLPMLVHQAAVAWELWTHEPAPLEAMWAAARAALPARA
jgi:shikimate dehydrogenase